MPGALVRRRLLRWRGRWRHGWRGCPRTSRRSYRVFPGRTGRGERGGDGLDDQANFLYRQQQLADGLVFAAQPVEHVAIEQAPNIKTFVGTSTNAVKTQIWTALICMLLLRYRYSGRLDNTFSLPLLASCVDLAASAVTRPSASPLDEPPPQATSDKDAVTTSAARGIRVENMVSLRHLWWPPSAFRAQWGMQARVQPTRS